MSKTRKIIDKKNYLENKLLLISINFNLKTSRSWFRKKLYTKCFPVEVYSITISILFLSVFIHGG